MNNRFKYNWNETKQYIDDWKNVGSLELDDNNTVLHVDAMK